MGGELGSLKEQRRVRKELVSEFDLVEPVLLSYNKVLAYNL